MENTIPVFYAKSITDWQNWLATNSEKETRVRLIVQNKGTGMPNETFVEAALCHGWIDSVAGKFKGGTFLTFTPRKPKSNWSKVNRERAEKLIEQGLMQPAGQKMIDLARQTGTWDALADADNLIIPPDLKLLLDTNAEANKHFEAFAPSSKKRILSWIITAKRPGTRQKRIEQTVVLAQKNIKAHHP